MVFVAIALRIAITSENISHFILLVLNLQHFVLLLYLYSNFSECGVDQFS